MGSYFLRIVAAAGLCFSTSASATEIYGVWMRDGHPTDKLEFYDCGGKLCAKGILPMLDGRPPPVVLRNAAKTGANAWKGELFNPEDGKTYTGKITFDSANQLTLTGCLVAFLCQSETWTRVSGPPKPAPADAKAHESPKPPPAPVEKPHEPGKASGVGDHKSTDHKADQKAGEHKAADRKAGAPKPAAPAARPEPPPAPDADE